MAKFSKDARTPSKLTVTSAVPDTSTHEGGSAHSYDSKTELFLLAVTNFVREDSFYEPADARDSRYAKLVHQVTDEDPEWVRRLVRWLRHEANMRTVSVVTAVEYVRAGGNFGREAVRDACRRGDEPAEVLGYWLLTEGKPIPQPIKRGLSDAVQNLYTEYAALRYDGRSRDVRMADVIRLCYPTPRDDYQATLFRWLVDRRRDRDDPRSDGLERIEAVEDLRALPEDQRRERLTEAAETFASWEELAGWVPGGMDAEAWEAVIPSMGFMALLRNLRNFDEAGVSDETADHVKAILSDRDNVAKSRQLPYRFYTAWKATNTMRWGEALESALEASVGNVPALPGETLVLVDLSGSMFYGVSDRSSVDRSEIAALFGASLVHRTDARLGVFGTKHHEISGAWTGSVLRSVGRIIGQGNLGGTYLHEAIDGLYDGEDRVVVFTDEQAHDWGRHDQIPTIVSFDLAGYGRGSQPHGLRPGRHVFGGLSDASFKVLPYLDTVRGGSWPF